jgi:hypothetical protein
MIEPSVLPVRGYEGKYLIFDDGRVYSVPRKVRHLVRKDGTEQPRNVGGKELHAYNHLGKRRVTLHKGTGRSKQFTIAALLFDHFGIRYVEPTPVEYISRFPREPGFDGYDVWETLPGPVESIEMGEEAWT